MCISIPPKCSALNIVAYMKDKSALSIAKTSEAGSATKMEQNFEQAVYFNSRLG
jgi:hypothetical protein